MPKVKSRGHASRTSSSGGAPKCASPRESVRASSSATQGLPAQLSFKRGAQEPRAETCCDFAGPLPAHQQQFSRRNRRPCCPPS